MRFVRGGGGAQGGTREENAACRPDHPHPRCFAPSTTGSSARWQTTPAQRERSAWTELGRACTGAGDELLLRERAGCVELRCNGWELMSNRAHHSETALARLACEHLADAHTRPQDAQSGPQDAAPHLLIGGLGLGYTLRAALDCLPASASVTVAELLPEIIAWNHGPLAPLTGDPLADPRVTITCADVASLLHAAPPARFDAILLDTDNGPDFVMLQGNAALYRPDTLRLARSALRPAGILAVWSADRSKGFEHALHAAGFQWHTHDIPARGGPDDPLHTIYLARAAA